MSKIRELLERNNNFGNGRGTESDDIAEQIDGYFEDVRFTLENIESMRSISNSIRAKIKKIRKEIMDLQGDVNKELS